ncbi:MAG TPA: hypothetical protein PLZ57_16215 [Pseudobdellovibrionaceae bacterium]|nr:hypothetical protein [Pseudobdellovibrionaceae bacterium]
MNVKSGIARLALAVVIGVWSFSAAHALPIQPVEVGGEEQLDACGGWGLAIATTTLFRVDENGALSFDRVEANQEIIFCDSYQDHDGEFVGVVIPEPGKSCDVSSPIPHRRVYDGTCKSGWIKREFTLLTAG